MTMLKRPVRRETLSTIRDGGRVLPIMVEIHPTHLALRQKGRRLRLRVEYQAVYRLAARLLADAERREKKARKHGSDR